MTTEERSRNVRDFQENANTITSQEYAELEAIE